MTHSNALPKIARLAFLLSLLFALAAVVPGQNVYNQTNLVSDGSVPALHIDKNLVNPWGIAADPFFAFVVAENGTGLATAYFGDGRRFDGPITIPAPKQCPFKNPKWRHGKKGNKNTTVTASTPTGAVYNTFIDADAFLIGRDDPAALIFATEDGTIAAWGFEDKNRAVIKVDNSATSAVYKGIAIAADGVAPFLFATDFHNNRIDVFNKNFRKVAITTSTLFNDPTLPAGFAPFGIQNINGNLYVTYAMQDADKHDNVNGPGLGFVDVYDVKGKLIRRFAGGGSLNAPWGIAVSPDNFGQFSTSVLIGNFGDGTISAFDPDDTLFLGQLQKADGSLLANPGLWGIAFGNGVAVQPTNVLFFAAGINDEANGLYGRIEAAFPTPIVTAKKVRNR